VHCVARSPIPPSSFSPYFVFRAVFSGCRVVLFVLCENSFEGFMRVACFGNFLIMNALLQVLVLVPPQWLIGSLEIHMTTRMLTSLKLLLRR
jgi:hypothetical protein